MPFFNIFSKKHEVPEEKPLIIADHREKNSEVISCLLNKPVSLEFKQLPIADYIINSIAIERKTVSDFKSSIMNKRIFSQLKSIQQYPDYLIILEGILDEDIYNIGMHENAFRGFLLSLAIQRTPIIYTHNSQDTAKYLYVLALKKDKSSPPSLNPKRILLTEEERALFILESFPNIGPITSRKLLSHFGSLSAIFSASPANIQELIGKRAFRLCSILYSSFKK